MEELKNYLIGKRFEADFEIVGMITRYLLENKQKGVFVKGIEEKTMFDDSYQDYEKIVILGNDKDELYDFSLYYAKGRFDDIIIDVDYEVL